MPRVIHVKTIYESGRAVGTVLKPEAGSSMRVTVTPDEHLKLDNRAHGTIGGVLTVSADELESVLPIVKCWETEHPKWASYSIVVGPCPPLSSGVSYDPPGRRGKHIFFGEHEGLADEGFRRMKDEIEHALTVAQVVASEPLSVIRTATLTIHGEPGGDVYQIGDALKVMLRGGECELRRGTKPVTLYPCDFKSVPEFVAVA